MMNPLVSVIVPVYNTENYVEQAIESILKQGYTNLECIIINDCSTDKSLDKILKYSIDDRVRIVNCEHRLGVGRVRNLGQTIAKGKFISFCDADDVWHEEKLELQVPFLLNNNLSFTCSSYSYIDIEGRIKSIFHPEEFINYSTLLNKCDIGTSTVIYNKEVLGILLMPGTKLKQDYLTWLRLLKDIGEIRTINKPLASIRVHSSSNSRNKFLAAYFQYLALKLHLNITFISFELISHMTKYFLNGVRKHRRNYMIFY